MRILFRTLVGVFMVGVFTLRMSHAVNLPARANLDTPVYTIKSEVEEFDSETFSLTIWNGGSRAESKARLPMVNGQIYYQDTTSIPLVIRVSVNDKRLSKPAGSRGSYPSKSISMWLIVTPGQTVTLKGHLSDFPEVYPYGGVENDILRAFTMAYYPLLNDAVNISVELSREDTSYTEVEVQAFRNKQKAINQEANGVLHAFLDKHPSSIAALYFMEDSYIRNFIDMERLVNLFEQVDQKYAGTQFYRTIEERIKANVYQPGKSIFEISSSRTPNGQPFSTKAWQGNFYLIDFWGSWCMPCIADFPYLKALRDEFPDDLKVLGIASDREEAWRPAIEQHGLNWQHILIGQGDQDFATRLNVTGYPTKILVDPTGVIVYRTTGGGEESFKKMAEIISAYKAKSL